MAMTASYAYFKDITNSVCCVNALINTITIICGTYIALHIYWHGTCVNIDIIKIDLHYIFEKKGIINNSTNINKTSKSSLMANH
jgi:hypothetical protein